MKKRFEEVDVRYRNIVGFIVILMLILAIRLFVLTVPQHEKWSKNAVEQNTKTILTSAPRGNIYDRKGNILATSKQIFTATFNASSMSTEQINKSSLEFINKLIENGDKYKDDFPIKFDSDGKAYYTYDKDTEEWLTTHGFKASDSAIKVLDSYRHSYKIDPELNRFEALKELEDKYKTSLPIVPKTMEFTYHRDLVNFWKKFGFKEEQIKKGIPAEKCFKDLRKKYSVDKKLSDAEARKIFIIRNEVASNSFTKYIPITIGTNISQKSVVYFEEIGIPGVEVSSSTERVYPNGSVACHALGYMGAISESEAKHYVKDKGYLPTDLVGKDGIEAAFEDKLHGKPGIERIKINSSGQYVSKISDEPAKKGSDVYLTIDLNLQKVAEQSLEKVIKESKYSRSGAVVAVDVETGQILAMASYPAFDLNMFADGISSSEWKSVQPKNPRDQMAPAPLYDNATRTSVSPGSIFKPVTAFAALKCGLDPNRYIQDKGHIMLGNRSFGCSLWNSSRGTHGAENLAKGMGYSCNYYFYCIATNKDWGTGASLGYKEDITIDKIMDMASKFGMGKPSGIEIGESVSPLASSKTKLQNYKIGVWNAIYEKSHQYFPKEVYRDPDRLAKNISTIAGWIEENPGFDELRDRISKQTEVKKDQVDNLATMVKFDFFNLATWTTADVFNLSIGQGDNTYTPVQMAKYVAAIANRGKVNDLSLVYGIQGEGKKVKKPAEETGIPDRDIDAVFKGMREVCLSGTMKGYFANYEIPVAGKSGTAQYQGIRQPADEVEYIKNRLGSLNGAAGTNVSWSQVEKEMKKLMVEDPEMYPTENDAVDQALINVSDHRVTMSSINSGKGKYEDFGWSITFAPLDHPKIAVATLTVEGTYGLYSGPIARDIYTEYFKLENKKDKNKDKDDKEKSKTKKYLKTDSYGTNIMQ